MKIFYATPAKADWYLITWDLSNKCNYRCSYCPSMLHDGSSGWPDYADVIKFVDKVNEQVSNKRICFRFSGGEPTYWNRFLELAKYIKSKGNYFTFLTNGSRDLKYFNEIDAYCDAVMLSYHPEYSKAEHFANIANVLTCPTAINLMLVPEQFNQTVEIAKEIYNSSNASIWPKVILDKTGDEGVTNLTTVYTDEQQQIINSWPYFRKIDDSKIHRGDMTVDGNIVSVNSMLLEGSNKYQGWKCWGGIDMLHVNAWGNVYRSDCKQTQLGTIKDFSIPTEPVICPKSICGCLSDLYLQKESC